MSTDVCTRCGRALENGLCPNGHPQRAARLRRRRPWRAVFLILLLLAILMGAAYGGLAWYPPQAAADAMGPLSERFTAALHPLRSAVEVFPEGGEEEALADAGQVLTEADAARNALIELQAAVEATSILSIPVVQDRAPIRLAQEIHEQSETFTREALELVGDLEAAARYLTEVAAILPVLENLEEALGDPTRPGQVEGAVAAAQPVAEQLRADLRSLSPPDELAATHAALLAVARSIRATLLDLGDATGQAAGPVVRALVEDIRSQLDTFRDTASVSPGAARDEGLRERIGSVERRADHIIALLEELRGEDVEGLTIPDA